MLPSEKKIYIDTSVDKINAKVIFQISPFYRKEIYNLFNHSLEPLNYFRGWLSVICAKYVFPSWNEKFPVENLPERFLITANKILLGKESITVGQQVADDGWIRLDRLGSLKSVQPVRHAFYSATVARSFIRSHR